MTRRRGRLVIAAAAAVVAALAATLTACTGAPSTTQHALPALKAGDQELTVHVDGRTRHYLLYVPASVTASDRPGLVLVFHGQDDPSVVGLAGVAEAQAGLDGPADAGDFLVAYPGGYKNSWNDHAGDSAAEVAKVDDVAFATALVKDVAARHPLDHDRVAAVGFSNGALFVNLLGCERADVFHAIVPLEGELPVNVSKTCAPSKPVSVLEVHGTADDAIAYDGGAFYGLDGQGTALSAPDALARWGELNGCTGLQTTQLDAGTKVDAYGSCTGGVTVSLRTLKDGDHSWPATGLPDLVAQALKVPAGG